MSEVDKIKEEFEKQYKIPEYAVFINGAYFIERPNEKKYMIALTSIFRDFKNGSKSRDKEIKKLKAEANCWRAQYMKLYERG